MSADPQSFPVDSDLPVIDLPQQAIVTIPEKEPCPEPEIVVERQIAHVDEGEFEGEYDEADLPDKVVSEPLLDSESTPSHHFYPHANWDESVEAQKKKPCLVHHYFAPPQANAPGSEAAYLLLGKSPTELHDQLQAQRRGFLECYRKGLFPENIFVPVVDIPDELPYKQKLRKTDTKGGFVELPARANSWKYGQDVVSSHPRNHLHVSVPQDVKAAGQKRNCCYCSSIVLIVLFTLIAIVGLGAVGLGIYFVAFESSSFLSLSSGANFGIIGGGAAVALVGIVIVIVAVIVVCRWRLDFQLPVIVLAHKATGTYRVFVGTRDVVRKSYLLMREILLADCGRLFPRDPQERFEAPLRMTFKNCVIVLTLIVAEYRASSSGTAAQAIKEGLFAKLTKRPEKKKTEDTVTQQMGGMKFQKVQTEDGQVAIVNPMSTSMGVRDCWVNSLYRTRVMIENLHHRAAANERRQQGLMNTVAHCLRHHCPSCASEIDVRARWNDKITDKTFRTLNGPLSIHANLVQDGVSLGPMIVTPELGFSARNVVQSSIVLAETSDGEGFRCRLQYDNGVGTILEQPIGFYSEPDFQEFARFCRHFQK